MNTTITALQLKHSTQGWSKLIGLGQPVDKSTKLDDSTMTTVGIDTLEYAVSKNAISTLEGLLRGANTPDEIEVEPGAQPVDVPSRDSHDPGLVPGAKVTTSFSKIV